MKGCLERDGLFWLKASGNDAFFQRRWREWRKKCCWM